jgi:hypothetical protein
VKRWDYLILVSKEAFDFNSTVSTLGFNFALLGTFAFVQRDKKPIALVKNETLAFFWSSGVSTQKVIP